MGVYSENSLFTPIFILLMVTRSVKGISGVPMTWLRPFLRFMLIKLDAVMHRLFKKGNFQKNAYGALSQGAATRSIRVFRATVHLQSGNRIGFICFCDATANHLFVHSQTDITESL